MNLTASFDVCKSSFVIGLIDFIEQAISGFSTVPVEINLINASLPLNLRTTLNRPSLYVRICSSPLPNIYAVKSKSKGATALTEKLSANTMLVLSLMQILQ